MAYKQKEYREKMKRDGSGMEKKKYILLDVGGTEIKGSVSDRNGVRTKIRKFPARAQKSTEKILDNFAKICRELMIEADGSVVGVGMAIPGPFDYENGISRMQGLNKYDAIYGIPLEREIKARVPELGSARFLFYMTLKHLHWEKAGTETVVMRIKFCASASEPAPGRLL